MTRQRWWWPAATGIAGLAAGFLLGGRAPDGAARPAVSTPAAAPAGGAAGMLTAEDVRRVVREELNARTPAGASVASVPAVPPEITPAQAAATQQAQAVLDSAIARRSWTEADADAMRETFDELTPDQQSEILRQYAVAVNQGRLVPQTDRIPF
jgi:hypothetical protein